MLRDEEILAALGYEPIGSTFRPTPSPRSVANRAVLTRLHQRGLRQEGPRSGAHGSRHQPWRPIFLPRAPLDIGVPALVKRGSRISCAGRLSGAELLSVLPAALPRRRHRARRMTTRAKPENPDERWFDVAIVRFVDLSFVSGTWRRWERRW